MDTIDEDQSMLSGDELEVDRMDEGPDLPGSLASREKVVLDLRPDGGERVPVDQSKVSEEDSHEDRAPDDLIEGDLRSNLGSFASLNEIVEPVVKVVSRGSMVKESEGRKGDESLHVERSSRDENLGENR